MIPTEFQCPQCQKINTISFDPTKPTTRLSCIHGCGGTVIILPLEQGFIEVRNAADEEVIVQAPMYDYGC